MKHIVVISRDSIGDKMAGPAIRCWNFAQELAKSQKVILLAPEVPAASMLRQGPVSFLALTKSALRSAVEKAGCVIVQGMTLREYPWLKKAGVPLVVDLYCPFILENFEANRNKPDKNWIHKTDLAVLLEQLQYGDYFLCASEKQKDFWLGMLAAVNRVNPLAYERDKTFGRLIGVVPFGMPDAQPKKEKRVLKGAYPGIGENDKLLLWGGGIWNWLDPLTAIRAVGILAQKRTDIKLFFMGTKTPSDQASEMMMVKAAMQLSEQLGLRDRAVFFHDWVNYEERQEYLLEADIGLSLHYDHLETRFSFRTRMLDYLWCRLPTIVTAGDVMAELVEKYQLGKVVPAEQPELLAAAIESLLADPRTDQFDQVAQDLTWAVVVKPLVDFCQTPVFSAKRPGVWLGDGWACKRWLYYLARVFLLAHVGNFAEMWRKIQRRMKR